VRLEGVVSIIGMLGGMKAESKTSLWVTWMTYSIARGINIGSREQFKDMNQFIDEHKITPVVDDKVFDFEDARAAWEALEAQQFFGKIVIKVKYE
jgi:NADPH:quinone reductase-like Zn-dependent oxidoreductase